MESWLHVDDVFAAAALGTRCARARTSFKARHVRAFIADHGHHESPVCSRAEYDQVKDQLRIVQEENCKLQAIITDVTAVNKRWQKYNNDRQMYVQSLLTTIQELQDHVNNMVGQQVFTSKDGGGVQKGRWVLLEEQVGSLQHKLDLLEREHREHIQVLELQLKSYRDDWEAERGEKQQAAHDRLLAQQRASELELEVRCLRRKLEARCGPGGMKHCECCRLSTSGESSHATGHTSRTYRTSAQLPTALENFQSYNDDLEIDGKKQLEKPGSCITSSTAATAVLAGCGYASDEPTNSGEQSEARPSQVGVLSDSALKLNLPMGQKRDDVAKMNIVREAQCSDRTGAVTIGFTSDGLAAVTTFANLPVGKPTSLLAERASDQASTSTGASDGVGLLTSWLPGLNVEAPPRSAAVSNKDSCTSERSRRRPRANYYEEGIATQTEENIICPGCGHVFPPKYQVDFLDHFELCQGK